MQPLRTVAVLVLALLLVSVPAARGASLQPVGSFEEPIYVTSDPGNPNRLFVVERAGRVRLVENGAVSTFADVSSVVGCDGGCAGERGLISVALAPDFDSSGRIYLDYAQNEDGSLHVAEMIAAGASAPLASLRDVLTILHPGESNHNGGQIAFGPDGYLYVSTGDGGGQNDEHENAQKLSSQLGKILRIDPRPSALLPYTVPPDNPFAAQGAPANTIWSYGLRNPFRFSFDLLSGGLTIGDVGQGQREEVDYAPAPGLGAGANYGWSCREGLSPGPGLEPGGDPLCSSPPAGGFVNPVFEYPHSDAGGGKAFGAAIIGGYVVRDDSLGDLYGRYLYGDWATGQIRSLSLANPFASDRSEGIYVNNLNSFGQDSCGRLYTVSGNGQVSRLVAAASPNTCVAGVAPTQRQRTYLGIRALRRRVERGSKALITAWVSPCKGRRGDRVRLYRGRKRIAAKPLGRACSVQFRTKISRRTTFRATVGEDADYLAAVSRRLKVRIDHRASTRRKARAESLSGRPRWP
jgi:glucose/arabinose dehydrogenase